MMRELPAWQEDEEEWSFLPVLDGTEKEVDVMQYPDLAQLWKEAFTDCKSYQNLRLNSPLMGCTTPTAMLSPLILEPSPEMSPEARKVHPKILP